MCPFTQVHYKCGHRVYTVRAWCDRYERTHVRCKVFVVAWEIRYACGPCRPAVEAPWMEALKLPVLTQRRLSRVWRKQPPPRLNNWKSPASVKCPPSMKWSDRRANLTPHHQLSHHRHHSPALLA